jgi:hypothetical protein
MRANDEKSSLERPTAKESRPADGPVSRMAELQRSVGNDLTRQRADQATQGS